VTFQKKNCAKLSKLGELNRTEEEWDEILNQIDEDGNDKIDVQEFVRIMEKVINPDLKTIMFQDGTDGGGDDDATITPHPTNIEPKLDHTNNGNKDTKSQEDAEKAHTKEEAKVSE
jgi:hypothetical protein